MKAGGVVMIFEDPYSRTREEGEARLIRRMWKDPHQEGRERWAVQFLGEAGEPVVIRTVTEGEVNR